MANTDQGAAGRKRRILVVDDDEISLEVMTRYLADYYDVVTAQNGQEAVGVCGATLPDIVLMDLMMPNASLWEGDEAIRRLSENPATAKIPVVIHTGFTGVAGVNLKLIAPNVAGVLVKPCALVDMKKYLDEILG